MPAATADMFYWRLDDCRAPSWRAGRVALLGDSACGFLPTAGIGASMAMESAAVLADELDRTDAKFCRKPWRSMRSGAASGSRRRRTIRAISAR
jgi:2-polyprenyl-6-methoxyphenol hydroxylase-like FAD-dependent oxidoreductase